MSKEDGRRSRDLILINWFVLSLRFPMFVLSSGFMLFISLLDMLDESRHTRHVPRGEDMCDLTFMRMIVRTSNRSVSRKRLG